MRKTRKDIIRLIQTILEEHEHYWDDLRPELDRYRKAYENKFWDENSFDKSMLRVVIKVTV